MSQEGRKRVFHYRYESLTTSQAVLCRALSQKEKIEIFSCKTVFLIAQHKRPFTEGETSPVALQLRAPPPKVSARAPAHRSYHFRGVKLKSCIKKIHHNLYISKQANVRIKHADTAGASHKKFGTDARVQ